MTECLPQISLTFHGAKRVEVSFDAPEISSDGGLLLVAGSQIMRWRLRSFIFQCQMHPFMAAILLGFLRLDSFWLDS